MTWHGWPTSESITARMERRWREFTEHQNRRLGQLFRHEQALVRAQVQMHTEFFHIRIIAACRPAPAWQINRIPKSNQFYKRPTMYGRLIYDADDQRL